MSKIDKQRNDPEAEVIAIIIAAIAKISRERKLALLKYIYERFSSPESNSLDSEHGREEKLIGVEEDIKAFLKRKNPITPYQQVAVLAYHLKINSGVDEINKKIIDEANRKALGRTIDNVTWVLNDAKNKYHFFGSGTGGNKILLAYGEDVVNALPDQKEVAELIKSRKKRRNKKRKKK